ncbi:MAG: alpha/beta hydrolase, partial [Pseudomonadota bacterium]
DLNDPETPVALSDAGAFGIHADGFWLTKALHELGFATIRYSRAGLYLSDPLPEGAVPNPLWHREDMNRLLKALGVNGPILLIGHSMAGLRLHAFAAKYPEKVGAVLFLDAVTPVQLAEPLRRTGVQRLSRWIGLCEQAVEWQIGRRLVSLYPNNMKLTGQAREDKVASWKNAAHFASTKAEILATTQADLLPHLPPITHCPVGVVSVTPVAKGYQELLNAAEKAEQPTRHLALRGAGHAGILSPKYAKSIADLGHDLWFLREARQEVSALASSANGDEYSPKSA